MDDLLDVFIEALNKRAESKKELIDLVADILNMEREPVYRRLSGKVQFTIREMGILAKKLNISIDHLLYENDDKKPTLFKMHFTTAPESLGTAERVLNYFLDMIQKPADIGYVVSSMPIEFFAPHPHLRKFMFFKWGHYNVRDRQFDDYAAWKIPESLVRISFQFREAVKKQRMLLYILDRYLIRNLVNEIKYYVSINILSWEDAILIKEDLHNLLSSVQELLKENRLMPRPPFQPEYNMYITNLHLSMSAYYIYYSSGDYISGISAPFARSYVNHNYDAGLRIRQWMEMLKRNSSLVSGSGEKERLVFLKEQYDIIDFMTEDDQTQI